MSVPLLIYWISFKVTSVVDSAPITEDDVSDGYLSNEIIVPNEKTFNIILPLTRRISNYNGYLFDETICVEVGDRILCGYERNKGGGVKPSDLIVDLGDDCFLRGDRIECGYNTKGYNKYVIRIAVTNESTIENLNLSKNVRRRATEEIIQNDTSEKLQSILPENIDYRKVLYLINKFRRDRAIHEIGEKINLTIISDTKTKPDILVVTDPATTENRQSDFINIKNRQSHDSEINNNEPGGLVTKVEHAHEQGLGCPCMNEIPN